MIKKLVFTTAVLLLTIGAFAQSIVGTWSPIEMRTEEKGNVKLTNEGMKKFAIEDYQKENPGKKISAKEMAQMTKQIPQMVKMFTNMKFTFTKDGKFTGSIPGEKLLKGTYTISEDGKELTISSADNNDKVSPISFENGNLLFSGMGSDMTLVLQKIKK